MSSRTPATFNPNSPIKPEHYMNQLIRIVQGMAPSATQKQWKRFGITARNIELSHNFHVSKAVIAAQSTADLIEEATNRYMELRLQKSQKDLKSLLDQVEKKKVEIANIQTEINTHGSSLF
ncbi:hypothetical protein GCK72_019024 [Caenorhabditis remanei]|uniref:Uncharacterized protein n=1 Tax=Caenorhabditis remanei TaxID=31234 RepID=A0A6A5GDG6_CAERE|nr:hypothetical protein GCK72_019024 [Caenorhabditis remanei]KAF1752469.1 hypothetical protein GCK72_019024 [Caenorhabditis remanei]